MDAAQVNDTINAIIEAEAARFFRAEENARPDTPEKGTRQFAVGLIISSRITIALLDGGMSFIDVAHLTSQLDERIEQGMRDAGYTLSSFLMGFN